ncbi:MAG: HD domain-containing protein [Patescibacteria group bacterium]
MDYQRINNAFEYASQQHADQRYAYNQDHYQVAHVSFTGAVLLAHGFDDDTVIAGILHDVVEDTPATIDDVRKLFGDTVATYVAAETVDQTLPWEQRQKLMQDSARAAVPSVKAIKAADLLHQLVLLNDPSHHTGTANYFSTHAPDRAYWKYEQLLGALGTGWTHPLLDEATQLLRQMQATHLQQ